MKKINLNEVAEAVEKINGGSISMELWNALRQAQEAGLNAEDSGLRLVSAEFRDILYAPPLSQEAEAVLLIRGKLGDKEAKGLLFKAYEGMVKKRAAVFYYHGNGKILLGDFDEAVSLACEAFYKAIDEAGMVKNGRLIRISNVFRMIAHRYETKEWVKNMHVAIPSNLFYAARQLDTYLERNRISVQEVSREICKDAGCCKSFGWMAVRDACTALRTDCRSFSDFLLYADLKWESEGTCFDIFSAERTEGNMLSLCNRENNSSVDTVYWVIGVIRSLSDSRKVRVFADYHGFNREHRGYSFEELAEKYGCCTRTVRNDIKEARIMIAKEMRRQDAEATAELADGRCLGYLKSQAECFSRQESKIAAL